MTLFFTHMCVYFAYIKQIWKYTRSFVFLSLTNENQVKDCGNCEPNCVSLRIDKGPLHIIRCAFRLLINID